MTTISYPLTFLNNRISTTSEPIELLRETLLSIAQTVPGELVYQVDYGLDAELFDTYNTNILQRVRPSFQPALDDISNSTISLYSYMVEGILAIEVAYQVDDAEGSFTFNL